MWFNWFRLKHFTRKINYRVEIQYFYNSPPIGAILSCENKDGDVSDEEIDRAIDVLNRAKLQKRRENEMSFIKEFMTNRI